MLDDFCPDQTTRQSRKRFGGSMAAAFVIYGTSGAVMIGATATARHVVDDDMTQVEFAPPPEPEPPPPVVQAPPPKSTLRPKVKRPVLATPDKIAEEKPEESDKELAAADEGGAVDGFLDGVEGGTGTAAAPPPPPPPPPKAEPLLPPVPVENDRPKYSASARRKGIEGVVVVMFDVLEDGRTANPQIVSGPEELRETVLKAALEWRFKPARRGGKPVRYRMRQPVTFRLEDA